MLHGRHIHCGASDHSDHTESIRSSCPGPAAQWHVADGIATVIIAAAVQQHTCFDVASVECHSSDVDNGQ